MIYKTYISKVNSIIKDSEINTSLNPVAELVFGKNTSRVLIYFDHNKIKEMMEDGTMPDKSKITHRLKITNAGSIDFTTLHQTRESSINGCVSKRASSFYLIFFLIPKTWDAGKGFDYSRNEVFEDFYDTSQEGWGGRLISTDGCNWYQRRNGIKWDEEGVYTNDTLTKEYEKYSSEEGSDIVFARQRFEVGNENIDLDITEIVNKFVSGELENNGIGIAFSPALERTGNDKNNVLGAVENYLGLFTNKTNTFFEPFVETQYHDYINDDRSNFVLGKDNKLYLYCNMGGQLTDLDELPTVTITDSNEEVVVDADGNAMENITPNHFSKGVYYINLKIVGREPNTMLFDTWDNIKYNGTQFEPVELDFTLKSTNIFFNIGNKLEESDRFIPSIKGINDNEDIFRFGDIRKVSIILREKYSNYVSTNLNDIEYRIYVLDGQRELTVIPYEKVNKTFIEYYFILDTSILLPQKYYIDVRVNYNNESLTYKNICHFNIVNSIDNKYS